MSMRSVRTRCPSCKAKMQRSLDVAEFPPGFTCGRCETGIPLRGREAFSRSELEHCLICGHPSFYAEKDFPRPLAFFIVGVGILLSFWTYGISLIVCGLFDVVLFKMLPMMRICYRCRAEYRGFPHHDGIELFDPHKGLAYDARQTVPPIHEHA